LCIINTFLFLANDLSTVTSHAGPIDLSKGSTLESSAPLLFPNQEQGFEKVGATTASSEETEIKPQNKRKTFDGTNDLNGEKSEAENRQKSKEKG
jgi:hypothetical protein